MKNIDKMHIGKQHIIQSNWLLRSFITPAKKFKDLHKDLLLLVLDKVDYYSDDCPPKVIITLDDYVQFRQIRKKDTYKIEKFREIAEEILYIKSFFFCPAQQKLIFFNFFQSVSCDILITDEFSLELTHESLKFFYKKKAIEYITRINDKRPKLLGLTTPKLSYSKIDRNIGLLRSKYQQRFLELLSQFRTKGFFRVNFIEFKFLLGFAYFTEESDIPLIYEYNVLFSGNQTKITDTYPRFSLFKRNFLDKAILRINKEKRIDIKNIRYQLIKHRQKVVYIEFYFKPVAKQFFSSDELVVIAELIDNYKLADFQAKFLIENLGIPEINARLINYIAVENKEYMEKWTRKKINNIGAYLYKYVFPELQ